MSLGKKRADTVDVASVEARAPLVETTAEATDGEVYSSPTVGELPNLRERISRRKRRLACILGICLIAVVVLSAFGVLSLEVEELEGLQVECVLVTAVLHERTHTSGSRVFLQKNNDCIARMGEGGGYCDHIPQDRTG